MSNADLSKLKSKYNNFEMKPKKSVTKPTSKSKFDLKLENELFSEFTSLDWIMYFQLKYEKATSKKYFIAGQKAWVVEHRIYKSLMKEFTPKDIKLLIDFIFESNQDIMPPLQAGAFLYSSKWIQTMYQSATLWQTGDYKNKAELNKEKYKASITPIRNREWTGSDKEDNKGSKVLPKRKKKSKITF